MPVRMFSMLGYEVRDPSPVLKALDEAGVPYEGFLKALIKCTDILKERGVEVLGKDIQVFKDHEDPSWISIVLHFKVKTSCKEAQQLWDEPARTVAKTLGPHARYVYTEVEPL